jgi:hypothetical protein
MLRRVFGPSRDEVWRQLSAEVGGQYVEAGFCQNARVQASHGEWTLTLDTYTVQAGKSYITYTRMRAPFVNPDGFRFTVYRRSVFSGLATFLGMQDVDVGDPAFDEDFVVKATDEGRVRTLFTSPRLRELIDAQRDIHLSVKDDEGWFGARFPDGVDELYFVVPGVIKDVERLKLLYDLFTETLDRLCAIGSAYQRDPGVAL